MVSRPVGNTPSPARSEPTPECADQAEGPLARGARTVKIAIIGAGAIGGYLGAKLALAGHEVTFLVRGANLEAIARHGMCLIAADGSETAVRNVRASNDYRGAGAHDLVVLA